MWSDSQIDSHRLQNGIHFRGDVFAHFIYEVRISVNH